MTTIQKVIITKTTASASQVMAGGTVHLNETGAGEKSNLNIIGSDVLGQQVAHGLLAFATSYATGQSVEMITATTLSTMGAEALAPKLSQYLYGTEKVADLNTEQKQTINNVLGTAGLVAGVVTAQATGADSMSSVSAGQQVQDSVQNSVENNHNGWTDFQTSALVQSAQYNIGMDREDVNRKIGESIPVNKFIQDTNDVTITSANIGMFSYAVVVNNKNGNIWTNIPDFDKMKMDVGIGVNLNLKNLEKAIYEYETKNGNKLPRRDVGFGGSIQIGNVVGKSKGKDIDDAINGYSVGGGLCQGVCVGFSKAGGKDGAIIITSGVGTPQIGMGGSMMRPISENEKKLLKKLGILK